MKTRGIIISGKSFLTENQTKLDLSGGIDDNSLKRYLVYWDEIHFVDPSYFGGLKIDDEKYKLLFEEKILKNTVVQFPGKLELLSPLTLASREIAQLDYYSKINKLQPLMKFSIAQSGNFLNLPTGSKEQTDCVELYLGNSLPVPINCTIEEILNFKTKREAELLSFRIRMNEFSELFHKENYSRNELVKAIEHIKRAMIDIHKVMDENKFQKVLTTVKTYLNLDDTKATSILLPLIGEISGSTLQLPTGSGGAIGLGINAVINLGIKKQNKIKSLPDQTQDFAYLYYIEELHKK